jgi:hypothetical protein
MPSRAHRVLLRVVVVILAIILLAFIVHWQAADYSP